MNIDIRLKLDLFEHPKLQKLRRRLGAEGVLCLLRLWLWAAANRCDGRLSGLDADDIELAARWQGRPGELLEALCDLRLLEQEFPAGGRRAAACAEEPPMSENCAGSEAGEYRIHDWCEHQAWACRSEERSARARKAAQARWGVEENKVEFQQDRAGRNAAMLIASPSNAPKAKNQEPRNSSCSPSPEQCPAPAREQAGQGRGVSQNQDSAEAKANAMALRQGGQAGSKNAQTAVRQSGEGVERPAQGQTSDKAESKATLPGSGNPTAFQPPQVTACEARPNSPRVTALTPELLPPSPARSPARRDALGRRAAAGVPDSRSASERGESAKRGKPPRTRSASSGGQLTQRSERGARRA